MNQKDNKLEELRKIEVGTIVVMGCSECEGLEKHKKLQDGTWECLWCGANIIKL